MTDRELMQQALEALEYAADHIGCPDDDDAIGVARKILRERLAQPYCDDCGGTDPECPLAQPEQAWITAEPHTAPLRTHWEGCEEVHPECKKPEQEPVAWGVSVEAVYETIIQWDEGGGKRGRRELARRIVALYATPPRREWVGLTLEEIGLLTTGDGWSHLETPALALFARAIEAKLKEKNA